MSILASSKSKSTPNKNSQKKSFNPRSLGLIISLICVLGVAFGIFQIYDIFQQALESPNTDDQAYSNYFKQQTVEELRSIKKNQYNITIPEGRVNPFK